MKGRLPLIYLHKLASSIIIIKDIKTIQDPPYIVRMVECPQKEIVGFLDNRVHFYSFSVVERKKKI